jgi:hypothetical protein
MKSARISNRSHSLRNLLLFLVCLCLIIGAVGLYFWNQYNPVHHGKRVYTWADQAIWDDDPIARREAVHVLLESLKDIHGEPRTQLLMRFCHPMGKNGEKYPLPDEVLPLLIEAVRTGEDPAAGYAAIALQIGGASDTVQALTKALEDESNPECRTRIQHVLEGITSKENRRVPVAVP